MLVLFPSLAAKPFRFPLAITASVHLMPFLDPRPCIPLDCVRMNVRATIDPRPIPIAVVDDDVMRIPYHAVAAPTPRPEGRADRLALEVHVDTEAGEPGNRVREVELPVELSTPVRR